MVDPCKKGPGACRCRYCDAEIEGSPPFCVACEIVLVECAHCTQLMRKEAKTCPHCGKPS